MKDDSYRVRFAASALGTQVAWDTRYEASERTGGSLHIFNAGNHVEELSTNRHFRVHSRTALTAVLYQVDPPYTVLNVEQFDRNFFVLGEWYR